MAIARNRKIDKYAGYLLIAALLPVTRLLGITLRRNHTQEEPPRHLLFIKLLGLGSLVLATDAIAAIRKQWPDTKLILLTDTNIAAGIAPFELFDEIWTIPSGNLWRTFIKATQHLVYTWKLKHVWVADLEVYSKLTTVYSLLTMANNRFGFYLSPVLFRKHLNTHNVLFNRTGFLEDNYRQMAKAITRIASVPLQPVPVREQEYQKPFIILNNTCSGLAPVRKLPDETFAAVCRWLLESTHYQLALSGAPPDKEEINDFINQYFSIHPQQHRVVNIAGTMDFESWYHFMAEKAAFMITIDSAPLHIARRLGLPTLSLWGPTQPNNYLEIHRGDEEKHLYCYLPVACSPCVHYHEQLPCGGNNHCMQNLTVHLITGKLQEMLHYLEEGSMILRNV